MSRPLIMSADDTALLVVDLQERLFPRIQRYREIQERVSLLLGVAEVLEVPVLATEQYSKGLGPTVDALAPKLATRIEKLTFSCCGVAEVMDWLTQAKRRNVLLVGIEAHVCIQQTALDLLSDGFSVFLPADAVGSQTDEDKHWALQRMQGAGVTVTTTESAVFEWTRRAGTAQFKQMSSLVKQASENISELRKATP